MEKCRVKVWSLDVWSDDGVPWVNDRASLGVITMRKADFENDRRLLGILKKEGFIATRKHLSSFNFDGDEGVVNVDFKGWPIFQLEIMEN